MYLFIVLLGLLLGLLGVIGLLSPDSLIHLVTRLWMHPRGLFLAMGLRLFFGIIMITSAAQTRAPLAIEIIGVLSIAGALALPLIGLQRMQRLLSWWTSRSAAIILWSFSGLCLPVRMLCHGNKNSDNSRLAANYRDLQPCGAGWTLHC